LFHMYVKNSPAYSNFNVVLFVLCDYLICISECQLIVLEDTVCL
jgi:hypothetical protein